MQNSRDAPAPAEMLGLILFLNNDNRAKNVIIASTRPLSACLFGEMART